jgi:hypothetical protein
MSFIAKLSTLGASSSSFSSKAGVSLSPASSSFAGSSTDALDWTTFGAALKNYCSSSAGVTVAVSAPDLPGSWSTICTISGSIFAS